MDSRVSKAIVLFLKDQGYEDTARKLLEESGSVTSRQITSSADRAISNGLPPAKRQRSSSLSDSADKGLQESLDAYSESYRKLIEWLYLTLDQFRDELWPVSWVVYVHLYLKLVEEGRTSLAVEFREDHKSDHVNAHEDEIRALSLVTSKSHLSSSGYVQRVRKHRFEIYLCNYSVEMLISFLLKNNMLFILSIVNDHIHIKDRPNKALLLSSVKTSNESQQNGDTSSNVVTGISSEANARINSSRIQWGVNPEFQSLYMQDTISGELSRLRKAMDLKSLENVGKGVPNCPTIEPKRNFAELIKYVVDPQRLEVRDIDAIISEKDEEENKNMDESDKGNPDQAKTQSPGKGKDAKESANSQKQAKLKQVEESEKAFLTHKKQYKLGEWPSIAFSTFFNCHDELVSVDFSNDGDLTAAGFDDSSITVWHQPASSDSGNKDLPDEAGVYAEKLVGHSGPVYSVSFNREGQSLLSSSADGYIRLWLYLPSSEKEKASTRWHNVFAFRPQRFSSPCPVWDVQFSPVGHYFASGSHDNACRIWDVEHSQPLRTCLKHLSDVDCVKWHPNCHYVASGSSDKTVRLWDIRDNKSCRLFCGHNDSVNSLVFDPSGRYLVSGGQDNIIQVWDIAAGKKINTLQGHSGPIWSLDVSADGKYLSSGSADGTIRLWNTEYIWSLGGNQDALELPQLNGSSMDGTHVSRRKQEHHNVINAPENVVPPADYTKPPTLNNKYSIVRTYRTKYTPVQVVRFHNERLLLAAGSFALPLMT